MIKTINIVLYRWLYNWIILIDKTTHIFYFNNKQRFSLVAGVILGIAHVLRERGTITHRIRWGGDFNQNWDPTDDKFYDGPHFEFM